MSNAAGASGSARRFEAGAADAGKRLDVFLAERLALSRAQTRRLLGRGAVTLDGRAAAESDKGRALAAGARVEVAPFRAPAHQAAIPDPQAAAGLRVLAEGPGWLAVDKPAGMPVHPLHEDERGTLLNAVAARHPELQGVGEGGLRSGVVHRLDVDTSGVVLVATQQPVWERLRGAFAGHAVDKRYRALVWGELRREHFEVVELSLAVTRHRPARVRAFHPGSERASRAARLGVLRYRTLEVLEGASLLDVRPRTGFLHQIRATFAHLGYPLVGDAVYGPAERPRDVPHHLLHAAAVRLDEIAAEAEPPAGFREVLERLRRPSAGA